jgi:hypothetical protein
MAARLLIAVGEAAGSADELPAGVRALIDAADAIMVIAPRLPGRLDWLTSDTDRATAQADERLPTVLGQLDETGRPASGRGSPTTRCWRSRTPSASSILTTTGIATDHGLAATMTSCGDVLWRAL